MSNPNDSLFTAMDFLTDVSLKELYISNIGYSRTKRI